MGKRKKREEVNGLESRERKKRDFCFGGDAIRLARSTGRGERVGLRAWEIINSSNLIRTGLKNGGA